MKKIYSVILILAVLLNSLFADLICAKTDEFEKDTAQITLDSVSPSGSGFSLVETGTSKEHSVAVIEGLKCWLLDSQSGESNAYINFVLADNIKNNNNDGSVYEIIVEYYDTASGFFNLYYDAQKRKKQRADTVYMTNTLSWKKKKFVLDDTYFNKRLDGKYDFCLSIKESGDTSSGSIPIKGVKVVRRRGVNPIWITSESNRSGNAFEWFSDQKYVINKFKNLTDREMRIKITHNIVSKDGYKAYSKQENMTFSANEEREESFDFSELTRCDVYYYIINVSDDTGEVNSELKNMELAIVKTDPNGIKDDKITYAAHFSHTSNVLAHEAMWDILKLSNGEGGAGVQWSYVETSKGVLTWGGSTAQTWEGLRKSGLKSSTCLFQHSPAFYSGGGTLPFTDEEFEAWRNYIRFAVEKVKDINSRYVIWNEPNITSFNKLLDQRRGDVYTKTFIAAVEEIKKIDPNAKVGGPTLTGIHLESGRQSGRRYWKEVLDSGFAKYADAIVLHPYTSTSFESAKQTQLIKKYKDEFIAAGGKDPEMWHTEVGFTKSDAFVGTSRMQGALNARAIIQMYSADVADKIGIYNLEETGTVLTNREHMFGLVGPKTESDIDTKLGKRCIPHESFLELTALSYILAQSKIKSTHNSDDGNLFVSRFESQKFGKDVVTFNTDKTAQVITLDLGCTNVTLFDEYGNETNVVGKDGKYTFVADNYPKYILGDIQKVNVIDSKDYIDIDKAEINTVEKDIFSIEITADGIDSQDCKIVADLPEKIKVVSNEGFKHGKAVIKLENLLKKGESSFLNLSVLCNDDVIQTSKIIVNSKELMDARFSVHLDNSNDITKWSGELKIKNLSSSKTFTGKVDFISNDLFSSVKDVNIGIVPPGRTGEAKISLPRISKMGQYFPKYRIKVDGIDEEYEFSDNVELTVGKYADNMPKIDGVIERKEWAMETAMYVDNAEQIRQLPDWKGPDDLSGKSVVMWDNENFYLCAIVTDDKHVNVKPPAENWNGDSMQFGVYYGKQNEFTAIGQAGTAFHEIGLALSSATGKTSVYRYSSQGNTHKYGEVSDAECVIKRDGNKTIYELKMPWRALLEEGDNPKEGDKLGYSFLFNESDTETRDGWIEYASGIAGSKDVSLFTYMTLIK